MSRAGGGPDLFEVVLDGGDEARDHREARGIARLAQHADQAGGGDQRARRHVAHHQGVVGREEEGGPETEQQHRRHQRELAAGRRHDEEREIAERGEHRARHRQPRGAEALGELAGERADERGGDRDHRHGHAGVPGAELERADQHQRQDEELHRQRREIGGEGDAGARELAALVEQRQVDERLRDPPLVAQEGPQRDEATDRHRPHQQVAVVVLDGQAVETEQQAEDRRGEQRGACQVPGLPRRGRAARRAASRGGRGARQRGGHQQRAGHGERGERDAGAEQRAPVVGIEQPAREDRPEHEAHGVAGLHDAERLGAFGSRIELSRQREGDGQEERHACALHHAQGDERVDVGRVGAGRHRERVDEHARLEDAVGAERRREPRGEQHQAGGGDEITERHPHHDAGAGVELVDDVRERDRHEARVEAREHGRKQQRREHPASARGRHRRCRRRGGGHRGRSGRLRHI